MHRCSTVMTYVLGSFYLFAYYLHPSLSTRNLSIDRCTECPIAATFTLIASGVF
jgi:hypothetical protein